jgi:DNA-binding MarR family transcriptional regulator
MKVNDEKTLFLNASAANGKRPFRSKAGSAADARKALVAQFDLHNSPGHLLRRCHSRARAIFDDLVGRETGLSKQQVALMVAISHNPAATHAQLAEETGFDRNTLADTIDRLIAKGLASRKRSTRDARAYEIGLTDAGQVQLEDLIPLSLMVQAKIIEPIPEALRQTFIECLQILAGVSDPEPVDIAPLDPSKETGRSRTVPAERGSRVAASAKVS